MADRPVQGAAAAPLSMHVSSLGIGHLVTVAGRLDARTVPPLRDLLHRLLDTGTDDVVLALGAAEIGDGTALGVLVWAHHRARRAGRRLVVAEVSGRTARLLRAARLDRILLVSGQPERPVAPLTASVDR